MTHSIYRGTAGVATLAVLVWATGCSTAVSAGGRSTSSDGSAPVVDIVFPLVADSVRFTSGFGDARAGGRSHHGQDIFCPRWTPILAATGGTVDWIATERQPKGKSYHLLLHGDDGYVYFYEHLNNDDPGTKDNAAPPRYAYARGLKNGDRVSAGEIVGYVGDSGDAEASGPHLHFEIHRRQWGNPFDPLPTLRAALAKRRGR